MAGKMKLIVLSKVKGETRGVMKSEIASMLLGRVALRCKGEGGHKDPSGP